MVVTFFLCWAPFHAQRLTFVYFKDTQLFRAVNEYLFHVSGFFYYFSATLNPILYNVMSLKYRQDKISLVLLNINLSTILTDMHSKQLSAEETREPRTHLHEATPGDQL